MMLVTGRRVAFLYGGLRMERNELWKLRKGWIAGYTEDRELIRRMKRYKKRLAYYCGLY